MSRTMLDLTRERMNGIAELIVTAAINDVNGELSFGTDKGNMWTENKATWMCCDDAVSVSMESEPADVKCTAEEEFLHTSADATTAIGLFLFAMAIYGEPNPTPEAIAAHNAGGLPDV